MKNKVLLMGASALMLVSAPVLAESGKDGHQGRHHGEMFEKGDLNGDGIITKDEFLKGAEERFSKMDADGDGQFTKDEAEAAHAKMKEKWEDRKEKRTERMEDEAAPAEVPAEE